MIGAIAEDHNDVIGAIAFLHYPGADGERSPGDDRPERFALRGIQGCPEADRGGLRLRRRFPA